MPILFKHVNCPINVISAFVPTSGGEADKEAGRYASNIRPKNIEDAIDKMRWYQHNYQVIFGRNPRREVKQASPGPHYGGELEGTERVCVNS
jgi:hypothetical protein